MAAWTVGGCDGILLTSLDSISRNTYLHGEKAEKLTSIIEPSGEIVDPDPSHSFITVTLTKALKKNVRRKLMLDDPDDPFSRSQKPATSSVATASAATSALSSSSLLTEVIVQINPVDLVLNVPVIVKTLDGLTLKEEEKMKVKVNNKTEDDSVIPCDGQSNSSQTGGYSYPLVYLNTKTIRVFMPCIDTSSCKSVMCIPGGGQGDNVQAGMVSHSDSGIAFEKQQQQQTSQQSKEVSKKREENILMLEVNCFKFLPSSCGTVDYVFELESLMIEIFILTGAYVFDSPFHILCLNIDLTYKSYKMVSNTS